MERINDKPLSVWIELWKLKYRFRERKAENLLSDLWRDIMGESIARQTKNISLNRGVLRITLFSAAVKQELHFHRNRIIQTLNHRIGKNVIKEIVFN